MASNNDIKAQRKAEKDKFRRKHRIIAELRFWLAGLLLIAILLNVYVYALDRRKVKESLSLAEGDTYRQTVVASCGETSVSLMAFSYFFYDHYYTIAESDSFVRDYRAYGLDPTKPLKESEYTALRSWFEELADTVFTTVEATVQYAELARQDGDRLSAEDEAAIAAKLASLEESAKSEGRSLNDYLDYRYGSGMQREDVESALRLYYSAQSKYNAAIEELGNCTEEELSKYYSKHRDELDSIDCICYRFEEKRADASDTEAAFAACTTADEFLALVEKDLPLAGCPDEQISGVLDDCQKRLQYGGEGEFYVWAFDSVRKNGDIFIRHSDGYCEVYYLVRSGGKYSFPSANVRALLVSLEVYKDEEATKQAAELLYNAAVKNGTEEYFTALVKENSHDLNTISYGGVYSDIVPGDLAEEYDKWLFADGRKTGDIGMVEADGSYSIFYYTGSGDPCWQVSARNALTDERVEAFEEELAQRLQVNSFTSAVYTELADNLAIEHDRIYNVVESSGETLYSAKGTVYVGFYCCLAIGILLLAATVWAFVYTNVLKKKYGYN